MDIIYPDLYRELCDLLTYTLYYLTALYDQRNCPYALVEGQIGGAQTI